MAVRVGLLCIAICGLGLPAARAQPLAPSAVPGDARVHFDAGASFATAHDYAQAAREFQAAYELDPRKESLFAWAQVVRLRGDCARAVELYRRFLASADVTPTQVEAANLNIRRCQESAETKVDGASESPPANAGARPSASAPALRLSAPVVAATPPQRSRRAIILSVTLASASLAALTTAGIFYSLSRGDERAALAAERWDDYYPAARRVRDRQWLAAGLAGAGVLLAGGAVWEWLSSSPSPAMTAWVQPGSAGVGLGGRY